MYKSVNKSFLFIIRYFEETIAVAIFLGIFISQSFQVFFRYVLQSPLTWTEELSRLFFIWLGFIGSVIVTKHKGHLSVDLVVSQLPEVLRKVVYVFIQALILTFLVFIAVVGTKLTYLSRNVTTPALDVSVAFMYAPVPLFAVLTLVRMIGQYIGDAKNERSNKLRSSDENSMEGV